VAVITRDEEDNIRGCLESVAWADERVVLDSGSTDGTVGIARSLGARVEVEEWRGYAPQKNRAAELCTGEWVLSIDADERVTEALRREIESALAAPPSSLPAGFSMPRLSFHLGRWIRRGGWYPDRKVRLARRGKGAWVGEEVHEHLEVEGPVGRLGKPLLHYTYRDLSDHLVKMDGYTVRIARGRHARGRRPSLLRLVLNPPFKFLRMYVLKGGFLEGTAGFILAAAGAWYVFLKEAHLWELWRVRKPEGAP
jgi:hypothetical protein